MRAAGVPLFSVEQHLPAAAFDVLAFNLSAELVYTNVVNLIDLAGLPLHAADRGGADALVVAGGHCAFNPEPLADFVDAFVLGDGEEVVSEVNEVVGAWLEPRRRNGATATRSGCDLARARGRVRAGALHPVVRGRAPGVDACPPTPASRPRSTKRTVSDLADWPYPSRPLVPADRGRPRPPERRGLPRLHTGLPLLPGRHDHPPGARAPRRPGARAWCDAAWSGAGTTR